MSDTHNNSYLNGCIVLPQEIENFEHRHIAERRKNCRQRFTTSDQKNSDLDQEDIKQSLTGLAISGGGIRSASFALGVMQALESKGLMKQFDYLSTVSGGGYMGAGLSWFLHQDANKKTDKFQFKENDYPWPWGVDDPNLSHRDDIKRQDSSAQKAYLDYFRQHGEYLMPGNGITIWSLIAVVIRAVFLNLMVYIPLLTTFITLFFVALTDKTLWFGSPPEVIKQFMFPLYNVQQNSMSAWFLVAAASIAILSAIIALLYSLSTRLIPNDNRLFSRYKFRRFIEQSSGKGLGLFLFFFVWGLLPVINQFLYDLTSDFNLGWANGIVFPIVGVIVAILPVYNLFKEQMTQSMDVFIKIAVLLLILGLMLSAYNLALFSISLYGEQAGFSLLSCNDFYCYRAYDVMTSFLSVEILSIPYFWSWALFISLISGAFVNLNYISIHRFYRDRLMETYMQTIEKALKGETCSAEEADQLKIHELYKEETIAPYHLINTNVILVHDQDKKYKYRGGDNFILSQGYCGSTATGWNLTQEFMDNQMTLPTAVAISGAAANPNAAPGGKGLTRSRSVSLLMAIFNLRLGYWAANPKKCRDILGQIRTTPSHFLSALYEVGMNAKKSSGYIQLSDGGHFDNLAVYELIRRRCKLIVLSDAGADPDFTFSDLQILLRRIEQDFNTTIVFQGENSIEQMTPSIHKFYPEQLKVAKKGYVIGEIHYPQDQNDNTSAEKSYLIYLKSTLVEGLDTRLLGYKSLNSEYPDESTNDQFFDAEQFDAYRELGYALCSQMLAGEGKKLLL